MRLHCAMNEAAENQEEPAALTELPTIHRETADEQLQGRGDLLQDCLHVWWIIVNVGVRTVATDS